MTELLSFGRDRMIGRRPVSEVDVVLLLSAFLLCTCLPALAQEPPKTPEAPKVRRPGGGAGMDYRDYDGATIERGKAAFVAQCAFCHGSNAKGGESGPDLIRAVPVIDDENGNLIGPIISGGRQAQGMPKFNM